MVLASLVYSYAYSGNNPINYNDPSGHVQVCAQGDLGGGCGSDGTIPYILNKYITKKIEGLSVYWNGLNSEERNALESAQWNEDVWTDTIGGPGVTSADPLHDPAVWITGLVTGAYSAIKLGPLVISALAEYFCFDGDCGNEINVSIHALKRMVERGVSIDQLQVTLQVEPFRYFHEGIWKLGFYDPVSRILVTVAEADNIITTVITNVKPEYIENLKKVVP